MNARLSRRHQQLKRAVCVYLPCPLSATAAKSRAADSQLKKTSLPFVFARRSIKRAAIFFTKKMAQHVFSRGAIFSI